MNILTAICNISISPTYALQNFYQSRNRVNSMGEALEHYIKDIFAGTLNINNESDRIRIHNKVFSYLGNQNNPPDIILRGGDAIEVKKIESRTSALALNSSFPKAKLFSNSPMITTTCRECELWTEKDIIYAVGVVNNNNLKSLCFVYGIDYAASSQVYERISQAISSGILTIPEIEFSQTNELGRVNRVDPLGITYLRIRGMWHIQNPLKTFEYIYREEYADFNFMALINLKKYNSFSNKNQFEQFVSQNPRIHIDDVLIKSPDNPANLKDAKLITFR